ncbi:MAG: hypothetical protein HYZ49_17780 [Chloroflexi bacterium]|nr:hypothetical protein [Chloroflexota bacterium]
MVHALNESWRVARAHVLDVRPRVGEPQVLVRDKNGRETICGGLPWNGGDPEGHPPAEIALSRVVAAGKFTVLAETQFDWIDSYGSADELAESVSDDWVSRELSEETALKLMRVMEEAGPGAMPFIRQPIGIRLLKKIV